VDLWQAAVLPLPYRKEKQLQSRVSYASLRDGSIIILSLPCGEQNSQNLGVCSKQKGKHPMNTLIQLKRATKVFLVALACIIGLVPKTQAVSPPPDGGYPGGMARRVCH
jgi:hypothetical protein